MTLTERERDTLCRFTGGQLAEALARQGASVFGGRIFSEQIIADAKTAALMGATEVFWRAAYDDKSSLRTIDEIVALVDDTTEHIQEFIREERIPYIVVRDGVLIPLGGFQQCMNDLYDLVGALESLD